VSEPDALARLLSAHIDEYCTALQRAIDGAQEARRRVIGGSHESCCASVEATHVWVCRALDLWEEMMDVSHEHGLWSGHG